jgi:hypothetical protein
MVEKSPLTPWREIAENAKRHNLKWIKGYTQNGMRLYQCSCGRDFIAWNKKIAKELHGQ